MNVNVLKNMKCPKCGSEGPYAIHTECYALVHDDGIEDTWEHEWAHDSACQCKECGFRGVVGYFIRSCGYCHYWVRMGSDSVCSLGRFLCKHDQTCDNFKAFFPIKEKEG